MSHYFNLKTKQDDQNIILDIRIMNNLSCIKFMKFMEYMAE